MVDFKVQTQRLFCTPLGWKYEVSREVSGNMSRKGGRGGGGGGGGKEGCVMFAIIVIHSVYG